LGREGQQTIQALNLGSTVTHGFIRVRTVTARWTTALPKVLLGLHSCRCGSAPTLWLSREALA